MAGLFFAGLGSSFLWDHYREARVYTAQVVGTVSDIKHEVRTPKGKKENSYSPVYTYTVNGVVYNGESNYLSSSPTAFPVGMKVTIMHDPDNPEHFYVEERRVPLFMYLLFIAVGVVFMLVSRPWRLFLRSR